MTAHAQTVETADVVEKQRHLRTAELVNQLTDSFLKHQDPCPEKDLKPFQELILNLLPYADSFTKSVLAQKLAKRTDTPRKILVALLKEEPEVAEPLLIHSPVITRLDIDRLVARNISAVNTALLKRGDLNAHQRQALLVRARLGKTAATSPTPKTTPTEVVAVATSTNTQPQKRIEPQQFIITIPELQSVVPPKIALEMPEENPLLKAVEMALQTDFAADDSSLNTPLPIVESPAITAAIEITPPSSTYEAVAEDKITAIASLSMEEERDEQIAQPSPAPLPIAKPLPSIVPALVRAAVLRRTSDVAILISNELGLPTRIGEALLKDISGEALVAACHYLKVPEDATVQIATLIYPLLTRKADNLTALRKLYRNFTGLDTARIVEAWRHLPQQHITKHKPVHAPAVDHTLPANPIAPIAPSKEQKESEAI